MGLNKVLLAGAAGLAMTVSAQAQYSNDGIALGVLTDMSGVYADVGGQGSVVAAQMAIDDYGGEFNGKPIKLVSADHQNKADIGANIARQWADTDGVDAIFDILNSAVGLAVQQVATEKNIVSLNSGAATTALTNEQCSPNGIHYVYDTYALATGTGGAMVKEGGKSWFFIVADYAFGHALETDTSNAVKGAGGEVLGSVRAPLSNQDFSSFLLQAQASGADVIGLANAGGDTVNSIKQAQEFGIVAAGQKLAGLLIFLTDIHALGLETTEGLTITTGWYWDLNDETREFADRYAEKMGGSKPTMVHAGVYSSVMNYLKAAEEAGTDDGKKVVDQLQTMTINDMFAKNGKIREDGLHFHDMYLAQIKAPSDSKGDWDYYNILATIPAAEAYQALDDVRCPLLEK
ncbi:ABC transporter substrate-binding protein [Acuticoccus sp. I52.16.1]|uniref:ABC transporter substrate-binding protein n=1 Tax=Acuticoccus sp. I52.16.1 TaxID=2928472 RepID=UPI001FD20349|nr:ABC transporter substrate-binding protein [Acuticoccus sp. I52.16.1]UOM33171.1 ABC transporter substrate-binding protein [Acuticoccus sp. I52.16.1]